MIIKKFLKFMIIGLSGSIINLLIFGLLIYINFGEFMAAAISFCFAATNNFFWNFKWTFKNSAPNKSIKRKYIEFFLISLMNFFINLFFLRIFLKIVDLEFLNNYGIFINNLSKVESLFAQAVAIGITSIFNFLGNYLITFKGVKDE